VRIAHRKRSSVGVPAGGCQRFGEARHPGPGAEVQGARHGVRIVSANTTTLTAAALVSELGQLLLLQECRAPGPLVREFAARRGGHTVGGLAGPWLAACVAFAGSLELVWERGGAHYHLQVVRWSIGARTVHVLHGYVGAVGSTFLQAFDAWVEGGAACDGALALRRFQRHH